MIRPVYERERTRAAQFFKVGNGWHAPDQGVGNALHE